MRTEDYIAMGASLDLAEALAASDERLAEQWRLFTLRVGEQIDREFMDPEEDTD